MVIYMYLARGQAKTTPWDQILFINSIIQSILSFAASFPPLNDFVIVSPFKCTGDPIRPCRKICQGQPRVIFYINFVELESQMLHAKFHDHRTSGSGKEEF